MAERPILFSAPMVRAILAGTKTQTRRAVKNVKHMPTWGSAVGNVGGAWLYGSPRFLHLSDRGDVWGVQLDDDHLRRMCTKEAYGWGAGAGCPYGAPGDRLWVREAWRITGDADGDTLDMFDRSDVQYRADDDQSYIDKYRPSIHMPRRFSRITLEITGVRVERLQAISAGDAVAEGIPRGGPENPDGIEQREYRALWEQINGAGSWAANPWVWVLEFKRV